MNTNKTWADVFKELCKKDYFNSMMNFIDSEYQKGVCYPPKDLIFNAFKCCDLDKIKVVMVGQDPYHEANQAMGLCFSVPTGTKVPPSLVNIYKELELEYNTPIDKSNGDLTYIAKQGVFMMNTYLTVKEHEPLSHNIKEYKLFLKDILNEIDKNDNPIVFLLWGGPARSLKKYITNKNHLVLEATHPSPLGANHGGWFNCNHFRKTNAFLKENGLEEIKWIK